MNHASWPNDDAPTAGGWDLKALRKEPVFEDENVKFHFETSEIAKARRSFDAD